MRRGKRFWRQQLLSFLSAFLHSLWSPPVEVCIVQYVKDQYPKLGAIHFWAEKAWTFLAEKAWTDTQKVPMASKWLFLEYLWPPWELWPGPTQRKLCAHANVMKNQKEMEVGVSPSSNKVRRNWFRLSWLATMVEIGLWEPYAKPESGTKLVMYDVYWLAMKMNDVYGIKIPRIHFQYQNNVQW